MHVCRRILCDGWFSMAESAKMLRIASLAACAVLAACGFPKPADVAGMRKLVRLYVIERPDLHQWHLRGGLSGRR
jgi:hypothetical protein